MSNTQVNTGVELLSNRSDEIEIDTSEMNPCLLTTSPEHCTNGGVTYMFWIKQLDDKKGGIITTYDWNPGKEGFRIYYTKAGYLVARIRRKGAAQSGTKIYKSVSGMKDHINSWLHVAVVYLTEPVREMHIYLNGEEIGPDDPTLLDSGDPTSSSDMRMKLGRLYVILNSTSTMLTKNMIFDEFYLYDKQLHQRVIANYIYMH